MRTIYLDMDGVMAGFDEIAKITLGRPIGWELKDITHAEWMWLAEQKPRLFRELPICEGAIDFSDWLIDSSSYNVEFLTAIPRSSVFKYAAQDKITWANENFPGIEVCIGPYSKDKQNLARIGDMLIDDKMSNIEQWAEQGGQAIYHPTNQGFKDTYVAVEDCLKHTRPGIWRNGKRESIGAK